MGEWYTIWVKEPVSHTWHGLSVPPGSSGYRTGCGLELDPLVGNVIWPVHPGEPGPPEFERCQWCEAAGVIQR